MGKSKFQTNAQQKVKAKSYGNSRPQYYDEKIKTSPQSSSRISVKSLAVVAGLIVLIGGGIFGVGNLLDNQLNPDSPNVNPNYTVSSESGSEVLGDTGYKMDLAITDIDGNIINLADHAGKVIVLYFHFLDCPPCATNGPNLQGAMNQYNSTELLVISISVMAKDTPAQLREWATDGGYEWEIVKDTDYSLSSRFGASATPHMAFLGLDGAIETTVTGIKTVDYFTTVIDGIL